MNPKADAEHLVQIARQAGIEDPAELANFMGQMEVESDHFTRMNENLHYSGDRLLDLFHGRNGLTSIKQANAIAAAGPERVAEAIYGGDWGGVQLGNIQEGDGWRFHGRGYVQLTGRRNYEDATKDLRAKGLDIDLVNHPDLAADRDVAAQVAVLHWQTEVRNRHHQHDVVSASYDINGGTNGLSARVAAAAKWETKLAHVDQSAPVVIASSDLKMISIAGASSHVTQNAVAVREGAHGATVKELQTQLNASAHPGTHGHALHVDGSFGPATRHAVENFQRDHGLVPDGIAGRQTLNALHVSTPRQGNAQPSNAPAATQLNDPAHPDHALFTQAQGGVHRLDAEHGRASDPRSDNLAASLVVAARNAGMSRVDHVALSSDAASVFAVQGALNSPFRQLTSVPTVEALNTPMPQSTQAWERVMQQTSQSQELPVSQAAQQAPREAVLPILTRGM